MTPLALGEAFIRLGTLLSDPEAELRDVAAASHACGLRLEFRLVPESPEPAPAECEHVWVYSLGDLYERCVQCGATRTALGVSG